MQEDDEYCDDDVVMEDDLKENGGIGILRWIGKFGECTVFLIFNSIRTSWALDTPRDPIDLSKS
jgi:hypothetical protein